ncbi:MAG: hypothetical protein J6C13_01530 [Clostridia bacterium]|nr:hypothetical protein [Clostridia bacterium]
MEKLNLTVAQQHKLDATDNIIKSGDVNAMIEHLIALMEDGLTPTPRQIAKISAHIYKTGDKDLITEFGIKFAGLGSFTQKLAEIVLEQGSAEDNFDFAQYVPDADILAHGKAIRKKKSKMWWVAFARLFPEQARVIMAGKDKTKQSELQR